MKKQVTTILKEAKKAKKKEVVILTLDKKAFKAKLSTTNGFGSQDLKPSYLEIYSWLLKTHKGNLITTAAGGMNKEDFAVEIKVKL